MKSMRLTGWRRVAAAMWHAPDDPQIFGRLEVDARPLRAFIDDMRARGEHVTPTHLVGRAVAYALQEVPELNVMIWRSRAFPRRSIDVFFITAVAQGDLSGVKVMDVDEKTVTEVATEVAVRATELKAGLDPQLAKTKRLMDVLPPSLLRLAIRATSFVTQRLQLDVPGLGLVRAPFGSAMVSSIGMLGLPEAFAPLAWMYDVPLLVLIGEITPRPVVENGAVVVREVLPLTATIDHRFVDGWHIQHLLAAFRRYLAAPEDFERDAMALTPDALRDLRGERMGPHIVGP